MRFFFCVCAATQGAKQGKNAKTETPVFLEWHEKGRCVQQAVPESSSHVAGRESATCC